VWSTRDRKRIRKTFPTLAAARSWRHDAQAALKRGTMRAPSPITIEQAAEAWLQGAREGTIRNRSGDRYKPSVLRSYEAALRIRILPELGAFRLSDLQRPDVQDFVDRMVAGDLDPSTVRNTVTALRAICRRALARGEIALNPTSGVELPAVRGRRDRIASPAEAARLVEALPVGDQALWATALYAGLRLGEIQSLQWTNVDLAAGILSVETSWDPREGEISPKSHAGRRKVPIAAVLRGHLLEHRMESDRGEGLVFGRSANRPFNYTTVRNRALAAWRVAGLEPITLHEGRHSFASLMIAAGVNAKALSTYLGHASVTITFDRYGHLMPGNEEEAAGLLDAYLKRSNEQAAREAVPV
jgi:integrase